MVKLAEPARERETMPKLTKAQQVRNDLKEKIDNGHYRPGDRLPSGSELTKQYGVSMIVVREAYNWLKATGYVESIPGKGYYVAEHAGH